MTTQSTPWRIQGVGLSGGWIRLMGAAEAASLAT